MLVPYLTKASHFSAPFISTFLLVHLSAPLVANIGGASLSSQVMLLGREYYQGQSSEYLLLFAPLALHVSASTLKRILAPAAPRPAASLLSLAGYAALLVLPLHVLVNRVYPADPAPPIRALGPAQLDYAFVQHALQTWPVRSALLYAGLAAPTLAHALEGVSLMWDLYLARPGTPRRGDKGRVRRRRAFAAVAVLATVGGLYSLWAEPLALPLPSFLSRVDAVFKKSLLFRL